MYFQEEMAGYLDESSQMSDIRIHVKEISSGKILRGEEAPLASELENWLKENPGYVEVPRDEVHRPVEDFFPCWLFCSNYC
jgi:SWI/SNF-related matrix-associated actin-dependent regulator of chromatin subfamily A protein 2/4